MRSRPDSGWLPAFVQDHTGIPRMGMLLNQILYWEVLGARVLYNFREGSVGLTMEVVKIRAGGVKIPA